MAASLRSMGLPSAPKGNGGQGGSDRRGSDEPNRRPASVKASLSVAFGQRAPNRAGTKEDMRHRDKRASPGGHWAWGAVLTAVCLVVRTRCAAASLLAT